MAFVLSVLYYLAISILFAVFTLILCFVVYVHHKHKTLDHIPGPKRGSFFWGNAKQFHSMKQNGLKSGAEVASELCQMYGPLTLIWIFHIPIVFVSDADLIKKILVTNNFPKDQWSYDKFSHVFGERFLGKGLVSETDHEQWKVKRLALNPAFHRKYLKDLMSEFNSSCDAFLAKLSNVADGKTEVKMADEFNRITLDIIGKVAFGIDLNAIKDPDSLFPTAVRESLIAPIWAMMHPFHAVDFTSYGYQNMVVEAVHFLRDTGKKVIDVRRRAMKNGEDVPSDILTHILKTVEEDADVNYEELLDHFVTFFIAGQETTAAMLAFMLAEIGKYPEVEDRMVQEAEFALGSRQYASYDDIGKLHYTSLVMKETLRLHPSAPAFTRVIDQETELGGHLIPAGTLVNLLPYAMHHNPKYWNDPEKFDPERFAVHKDESEPGFHRYAYYPFSLGPRHCIGQTFAEFEAKVLISRFLNSFKFKLVPGQDFGYEDPKSTLSPKGRLRCTLTLR